MCMHKKWLFLCLKIFENNPFHLDTRDRCQSKLCMSTSHRLLLEFYCWDMEKAEETEPFPGELGAIRFKE